MGSSRGDLLSFFLFFFLTWCMVLSVFCIFLFVVVLVFFCLTALQLYISHDTIFSQ